MIAVWVGVGAAAGAPVRYLTHRAMQRRFRTRLPLGTLLVNLVAAFVLGVLAGFSGLDVNVSALVGTGFCGTLSTWSTLAFEVVDLVGRRERLVAVLYLGLSVGAGVGLAAIGWAVGAGL